MAQVSKVILSYTARSRPTWATGNESKVVWEQRSLSVTYTAHSKPAHRQFNSASPRVHDVAWLSQSKFNCQGFRVRLLNGKRMSN